MDYGVGNLFSLKCSLERAGFKVAIGTSKEHIKRGDVIFLPGVGDFTTASRNLAMIKETIVDQILGGKFIFGICLGMQLLFHRSEEGDGEGLGLLDGENKKLPDNVKVPHMGWDTIKILKENALFCELADEDYYYFAHSYYPVPNSNEVVYAETNYGIIFASVIIKGNVYGTQFHPEKSGNKGLKLLENFHSIVKR
ncbi:MAG: imidazole glycerol phosphate synthase subunit HisH [Candidatus Bathyarchaeia archaeon]